MDDKAIAREKIERAEKATDAARDQARSALRRIEMALSQRTVAGVLVDPQSFHAELDAARQSLDQAIEVLRNAGGRWPRPADFDESGLL